MTRFDGYFAEFPQYYNIAAIKKEQGLS